MFRLFSCVMLAYSLAFSSSSDRESSYTINPEKAIFKYVDTATVCIISGTINPQSLFTPPTPNYDIFCDTTENNWARVHRLKKDELSVFTPFTPMEGTHLFFINILNANLISYAVIKNENQVVFDFHEYSFFEIPIPPSLEDKEFCIVKAETNENIMGVDPKFLDHFAAQSYLSFVKRLREKMKELKCPQQNNNIHQ